MLENYLRESMERIKAILVELKIPFHFTGGIAVFYSVVSTKNCTIAARRIPPSSLWGPRLATERFWLLHRSREHLSMPAEHPLTPRSCRVSLGNSLISLP